MEILQGKDRERAMVLQHRELPTAKLNSMKQNPAMRKKTKTFLYDRKPERGHRFLTRE